MRYFLIVFFVSRFVGANPQNPPPNVDSFRWLYEILFNATDRHNQPDETFKSFYVHLLDTNQNFPHPDNIEYKNLNLIEKIEGLLTYVNVIKKKYSQNIFFEKSTYIINVKIHFKDPQGNDIKNLKEKIKQAESIWNNSKVKTDFNYYFKFEVVDTEADSNFSVNLLDQTRGPYDRLWSRSWSANTIAHEIGHMLGLGDEYQTLSGKVDCLKQSLMCSSFSGQPLLHHYYFILRRLVEKQ